MKQRLLSLDVLRGITVMAMVLVNNGTGPQHFEMLDHSKWIGLTPCDLVFPMFLFMVGVSIWLSIGRSEKPQTRKILLRSLRMFAIGVVLHAWDMWVWGDEGILSHLRIWGVLERIALCYAAAGLLTQWVNARHFWKIISGLLLVYMAFLWYGNGYAMDESNWAVIIDRWLLSPAHLYQRMPLDPEGLMGTIPAIAHTLIGVLVGRELCKTEKSLSDRLIQLFLLAVALGLGGWLLSYGFPLCKRIWSPSYVLVTCGIGTGLLALLTVVIDVWKHDRWTRIPVMWGVNPFALYVLSEMFAPVVGRLGINNAIFNPLSQVLDVRVASLIYSLLFVSFIGLFAWVLWRKKWFIKI